MSPVTNDTKFLYLDESGDSGWHPDHGGNSNSRYFVYAGVIMTARQNYQIKHDLKEIMNDYFSGADTRPEEIHYADAVHAKKEFSLLSNDTLKNLRADIFDLILDIEPTLMATVVNKHRLKEKYGNYANPPKQYGFRATVDRFHKELVRTNSLGFVTMDAAEHNIDRKLRNLIYDALDTGIKLPGADSESDSTLPRLMDTVTVSPSEMSPGIQLADTVAYQVHHHYRYKDVSYGYEKIEHLFSSGDGFSEPNEVPNA